MAILFIVEGKKVMPTPENLLISPFKEIWERDKNKDKKVALAEFAYMEFMTSMLDTNPYRQYTESRKPEVIREEVIFMKDWNPDSLIKEGMAKITSFLQEASTTYGFYMASKKAAEKMKNFFLYVDVNERNLKTGNPIYKPKDITAALNDTERTLSTLTALSKKVNEEIYDVVRNKADKKISPFANPDSLG